MSDALNYLMEVRGETVKPYFDFLKRSGTHLDDKTRFLLSVISKVHAQTEKGFKQYLMRAMQAGNSADEILDALLSSMPMLGFSKIIWALDIILSMDIPEFSPAALGKPSTWHDICELDKLESTVSQLLCADHELFIYKNENNVKVYDARCPHQNTHIPLELEGEQCVTCPKHAWKFDLGSGECIENGNRPLITYQHRIQDKKLQVYF